jgi:hypothetical protein
MTELKQAVAAGLAGITAAYGSGEVRVVPDGQGGAWVEITGLDPGPTYAQEETFLVCLLPFTLPAADIYPAFVRADLSRRDGQPLGGGVGVAKRQWPGDPQAREVVQISRRTIGDFTAQTPVQKIEKVLAWLRSR